MDEHERTVKAAQQVDKMIGFYVHLVVFLLVCSGLAAVNWFATPQVWWAQWPFLGWGVAVVFHALCAFGGGPNFVAGWRLRKIRKLTDPAAASGAGRGGSTAMRTVGSLVLGIVVGCAAGGGYMYILLQDAQQKVASTEIARDQLGKTVKSQEEKIREISAEKSSVEGAVRETKAEVGQLQSAKQAAEQALKGARDELAQAQSARDAAERALAEAKKGTPQ
jgi:2TM domain